MNTYTLALICEWLGTFFLAAEAIKTRNLARLRKRFEKIAGGSFLWMDFFFERGWRIPLFLILVHALGVGALYWGLTKFNIVTVELVTSISSSLRELGPWAYWAGLSVGGYLALGICGFIAWLTLHFVTWAVVWGLILAIVGLEIIERNTDSGAVGIIGFL